MPNRAGQDRGTGQPVAEFAAWLRQLKLVHGDPSIRELERRTGSNPERRVARSTLQDAFDGRRLPSLDNSVAIVRAMSDDDSARRECVRRWRLARAALKGVELPGPPSDPSAAGADSSGTRTPGGPAPSEQAADDPAPMPGRRPPSWRRRTTVAGAAAVLAAAGGGSYAALHGEKPSHPRPAPAYTRVYQDRTLSLPDYDSYFDLPGGRVTSSEGAWTVSTNSGGDGRGAFELQPLTSASVAGRTSPSAEQCAGLIAGRPTTTVRFRQVPPGSSFCLRNRTTGDIAVLKVVDTDSGDYTATVSLTYYRHSG